MTNLSGQRLGKYELLERLGQGGMAQVYKAYQPAVERYVAVKVLHGHLAGDDEFVTRFKREARGLGQLRHPHIVSVFDFDQDGADGRYYMVMDYIAGPTLDQVLRQRGRLPVPEALEIISQVLQALDFAHRQGSIHRDVKPGNIMFTDETSRHAVLTDFGIARLVDTSRLTVTGAIVGSPAYISPEAARGEAVDGRSDLYSAGVILYEMVTGRQPFSGETPLSMIVKRITEPLPDPLQANPMLPALVSQLLRRSLATEPAERFQTAADFLAAVQQVQRHLADPATTPRPGDLLRLPTEETSQTMVLPDVTALEAAAAQKAPLPTPPAAPPVPPRSNWGARVVRLVVLLVLVGILATGVMVLRGRVGEAQQVAATDPAPATAEATEAAAVAATAEPTVAPDVTATATVPAGPVLLGTLQLLQDQFRLSLNNVPAPPANSHYELWLEVQDRPAPLRAAVLDWDNGRVTAIGILEAGLAPAVRGVLISIEPDFDDDPTISAQVPFSAERPAGVEVVEIFGETR